jgi:hypothetical protein
MSSPSVDVDFCFLAADERVPTDSSMDGFNLSYGEAIATTRQSKIVLT